MSKELKPCPFCGSTSLKVESHHNGQWSHTGTHSATVRCNKCHARGSTASSKVGPGTYTASEAAVDKAIELWNSRVSPPSDKEPRLPFAIGDTVYKVADGEIYAGEINYIDYTFGIRRWSARADSGSRYLHRDPDKIVYGFIFSDIDWGVTVFETQHDAIQAYLQQAGYNDGKKR